MIRAVRQGKEHEEETFEPVTWPPRRRSEPSPEREPRRKPEPTREPTRRKREKTPA
jgi:hypothetical protein